MERLADDPATSSAILPSPRSEAPVNPRAMAGRIAELDALLDREAARAARTEEVHRALVSVVLDGGDLADLAAELSGILAGPVLITTPDGRVVAQAGEPADLTRIFGFCNWDSKMVEYRHVLDRPYENKGKDMVEVKSCNWKGVMANQRMETIPAATMPIGYAAKSSIQGEGCLSGFHDASGTKSGGVGMSPR